MKKYKVWRPNYTPFMMGGNVYTPACITVHESEVKLHRLARGITVGVIRHNQTTKVFEIKSGGIVGDSLAAVKKAFSKTTRAFIMRQIALAKREGASAKAMDRDQFFRSVIS